jgi:predicted SprT family Zn-dependent metalloprotease
MPYPNVEVGDCGKNFGGRAYLLENRIRIASFILEDLDEAKGTIRHELAHLMVRYLKMPSRIAHGREFHQTLRMIAPLTWKYDCHWHKTEAILAAMGELHKKKYSVKASCKCPSCGKVYPFKKTPKYPIESYRCQNVKFMLLKHRNNLYNRIGK